MEEKNCTRCVCGVKILKAYILKSKILNKYIILGSDCLSNFEKDQQVLKNAFVKNAHYVII